MSNNDLIFAIVFVVALSALVFSIWYLLSYKIDIEHSEKKNAQILLAIKRKTEDNLSILNEIKAERIAMNHPPKYKQGEHILIRDTIEKITGFDLEHGILLYRFKGNRDAQYSKIDEDQSVRKISI